MIAYDLEDPGSPIAGPRRFPRSIQFFVPPPPSNGSRPTYDTGSGPHARATFAAVHVGLMSRRCALRDRTRWGRHGLRVPAGILATLARKSIPSNAFEFLPPRRRRAARHGPSKIIRFPLLAMAPLCWPQHAPYDRIIGTVRPVADSLALPDRLRKVNSQSLPAFPPTDSTCHAPRTKAANVRQGGGRNAAS